MKINKYKRIKPDEVVKRLRLERVLKSSSVLFAFGFVDENTVYLFDEGRKERLDPWEVLRMKLAMMGCYSLRVA